MNKIGKFFHENKKQIGIATGVVAAGVLFYWLFSKRTKISEETPGIPYAQQPASQASISSNNSDKTSVNEGPNQDKYDTKFARVVNQVRQCLDIHNQLITPQVISIIIKGQYQLANAQIKALITRGRCDRRSKFDDHLEYAKVLTTIQLELEEIQENHLGAILARFNIDKASWKSACDEWQMQEQGHEGDEEGNYGFGALIQEEEEKQLLSLRAPTSKPKQFNAIKQILKFKIKSLEVLDPIELGLEHAADSAGRYDIVQAFINDCTFNKFNIEEEDLDYSISLLSQDEKDQLGELMDKIGELMEKYVGEDEEEDPDNNFY